MTERYKNADLRGKNVMNCQARDFCKLIKNVIHPGQACGLKDDVDWTGMVRLAKRHNLFSLFMEEAVKYPSYVTRPEYEKEFIENLTAVSAQVSRTTAFLELYSEFVKEGIHPIVMKGLICRQLYGKLCDHRPSGDEDILIRPDEYQKAKEILIASGYQSKSEVITEKQLENLQEISFTNPEKELHIELHLNPMGRGDDARSYMSDCFKDVFDDYREVVISGVPIRTMSHQKHLLFLVLHAFKHFIGGGFGIRQMLDILLYQEQYSAEIDLKQLQETLLKLKADAFLNDMIYIGNIYFGFHLSALFKPNCVEELLEDMILCGVFGNGTQAERTAGGITIFTTENYLKNESANSFVMVWRSIFPKKRLLLYHSPYLNKNPWLLPLAWVQRWGRFIKKSRKNSGNLAAESLKISQRRIKVLKKYGIMR